MLFELLQRLLIFFFPKDFTLTAIQFILISLAYIIYREHRTENLKSNIFLVLFIFSSAVLLLGLFNSIRQSLAFLGAIIAVKSGSTGVRFLLLAPLTILIHKASIVFLIIFVLSDIKLSIHLKKKHSIFAVTCIVCIIPILSPIVLSYAFDVFERYSIYIHSAVTFREGRVGEIKIIIWLMVLFTFCLIGERRLKLDKLIALALVFTFFIGLDAIARGFDEFHSRLLLINNVFVFVHALKASKYFRISQPLIWFLLSINVAILHR